jgi:hypothetical protein
MEIANKFTDREDTYNNKRARSTEQAGKGAGLATRIAAQDATK